MVMKATTRGSKKTTRRRSADRRKTAIPVSTPDNRQRHVRAGEFKTICLSLMEQVRETGTEFVITKHGRPVAKLGPLTDSDLRPFIGRSRGVITATRDDLLAPLDDEWEADADL